MLNLFTWSRALNLDLMRKFSLSCQGIGHFAISILMQSNPGRRTLWRFRCISNLSRKPTKHFIKVQLVGLNFKIASIRHIEHLLSKKIGN